MSLLQADYGLCQPFTAIPLLKHTDTLGACVQGAESIKALKKAIANTDNMELFKLGQEFPDLFGLSVAQASFTGDHGDFGWYILKTPHQVKQIFGMPSIGSALLGQAAFDAAGAASTTGGQTLHPGSEWADLVTYGRARCQHHPHPQRLQTPARGGTACHPN